MSGAAHGRNATVEGSADETQFLVSCGGFDDYTAPILAAVLCGLEWVSFSKDSTIIANEVESKFLYWIKEGSCAFVADAPVALMDAPGASTRASGPRLRGGKPRLVKTRGLASATLEKRSIATLGPNQCFGDPWSSSEHETVVALTTCKVLQVRPPRPPINSLGGAKGADRILKRERERERELV